MKTNRFAGVCVTCGKRCGPGDGIPMKSEGARWRVQHIKCSGLPDASAALALAPAKRPTRDKPARRITYLRGHSPW